MILERSKRDPNVFLRRADLLPVGDFLRNGYENEESGFQTLNLSEGPKSLFNDLVSDEHENFSNINIGVNTMHKIEICMSLAKKLEFSKGYKNPDNFMIQNCSLTRIENPKVEGQLIIVCLFNHYDAEKLLTSEKLLYELDNLMLFEPQQPNFTDFPLSKINKHRLNMNEKVKQGKYPFSHFLFTRPLQNTLTFIYNQ